MYVFVKYYFVTMLLTVFKLDTVKSRATCRNGLLCHVMYTIIFRGNLCVYIDEVLF